MEHPQKQVAGRRKHEQPPMLQEKLRQNAHGAIRSTMLTVVLLEGQPHRDCGEIGEEGREYASQRALRAENEAQI